MGTKFEASQILDAVIQVTQQAMVESGSAYYGNVST